MQMHLAINQRAAVDQLIRTEWPKLERFLRTKVPLPMVQDITQATFLAYVERHDSVQSNHRAYLWQIARNQVLRYYERCRGRVSSPFDSSVHAVANLSPALSSALDRRDRVIRALQILPADQQMALELRYGEELSLEETAEAVGVSLATIKRYLAAAETSMRQQLSDDLQSFVRAYRG